MLYLIALLALVWIGLMALGAIAAPFLWWRVSRLERSVRDLEARFAAGQRLGWRPGAAEIPFSAGRRVVAPSVPPRPEATPKLALAPRTAGTSGQPVGGAGGSPEQLTSAEATEESAAIGPAAPPPVSAETPTRRHAPPSRARPSTRLAASTANRPSLEELIGVRLYVWVGALALFLAGAFLVKYGVDQGWITPAVRVALAVVLGTMLVAAAEWVRPSTAVAAHGLSAAGIGVLFAGFYAATSVYGLIPAPAGFLLMGLTGVTAVGLSLRHGVMVGVVGLLGGYVAPLVVQTGMRGGEAVLALYLLLLFATVVAAARQRSWWPVAAMAMAGSVLWALAIALGTDTPSGVFWSSLLVSASALAYIPWAPKPKGLSDQTPGARRSASDETTCADSAPRGSGVVEALAEMTALLGSLSVVGATLHVAAASLWPFWFFAALGVSAIALGRASREREMLPWTASAATAVFLLSWAAGPDFSSGSSPLEALLAVGALGAVFALGAYGAMWGARIPWRWAALSTASALGYFLIAYAAASSMELRGAVVSLHWGALAAVLAAVATTGVAAYASRSSRDRQANATVGVLAAGATGFLALAVPLSVGREWFAVAWSLEMAALAWLSVRTGFSSLRWPVWPLGALVAIDLLFPVGISGTLGHLPILNWLLYAYGVPILSFSVAAWFASRSGDREQATALSWAALAFGFVWIGLEIRHTFTDTPLHAWRHAPFVAASTYGIAWLAYGLALYRASNRWPLAALRHGGLAAIALGLATVFLVTVGAANPVWTHVSVGSMRIANWLAYAYGLPALLALAAGLHLREKGAVEQRLSLVCMIASLGLVFVLVTLVVRQAFHGSYLDAGALNTAENYMYSLSWVLLGSALLLVGVQTGSQLARWASLPIMLLTVTKVFLFDIAAINDLFRVLSFLGLGLSLVALGWVYQRLVFTRRAT